MTKNRKKILEYLYKANEKKSSIGKTLNDIKNGTGIDVKIVSIETDYLLQKGFIRKEMIATPAIASYSCSITSEGIDYMETKWYDGRLKQISLVVGILVGLFAIYNNISSCVRKTADKAQDVSGQGNMAIKDIKAGGNINTAINQTFVTNSQDIYEVPFVFAAPVEITIYKPNEPQVEGQEKGFIRVELINQSTQNYANNVHINFVTEDIAGHKTDSDSWNTQMGTKDLYTINSMAPGERKSLGWNPDLPFNSKEIFKQSDSPFKLELYVTWEDRLKKKYNFYSLSVLRYNKELGSFHWEVVKTDNNIDKRR